MGYPPAQFHNSHWAEARDIVRSVTLASIFATDAAHCPVVFAPFIIDESTDETAPGAVFLAHLVRNNPLLDLLGDGAVPARLVFQAADHYITPSVYGEKPTSGRVVPTWNYVAAQFAGRLEKTPDAEVTAILERQVDMFETAHGSAWRLSDAPADYVARLAGAVFGVRFIAEHCTVHKKLSQNRADDLPAIRQWLAQMEQDPDRPAGRRRLSRWMAPRP